MFLFVVVDDLHHSELWRAFFEGADPDLFECYYLSKNRCPAPSIPNFATVHNRFPPEYGHHTYVSAVLTLLEAGLVSRCNEKFIVLSDSCVPICGFDSLYREVMGDSLSYLYHFQVGTGDETSPLHNPETQFVQHEKNPALLEMFMPFYTGSEVERTNSRFRNVHGTGSANRDRFHKYLAQGICVQRELAEFLVETKEDLTDCHDVNFIEEHYYLYSLNKRGLPYDALIERRSLMAVSWAGNRPRTYVKDELTEPLVTQMRACGFFFLRKVMRSGNSDASLINFLLER